MRKVDGDGKFERVSGTSVGGGTFWGLGKLLTKCKSFDALLETSHQGNNRVTICLLEIYMVEWTILGYALHQRQLCRALARQFQRTKSLNSISLKMWQDCIYECTSIWSQENILWGIFHRRSCLHQTQYPWRLIFDVTDRVGMHMDI
nr:pantothenate kinase 1 [Tanacetum cinerariifolium]